MLQTLVRRQILLRAVVVLVLATYLVLALFTTPAADDFGYAARARAAGWLAAQTACYRDWTGRYTATFVQVTVPTVFDLVGVYKFLPLALLLLTGLGVWLLCRRLFGSRATWPALGFLALYVTRLPSVLEAFYWLAGAWTYQFGAALVLLLVAVLTGRPAGAWRWGQRLLAPLLVLLAVGTSEIVAALLLAILALGTVVTWRRGDERRWLWTVCLLVWVPAAVVLVTSPGNAVRAAYYPDRHQLGRTVRFGLMAVGQALWRWLPQPLLWAATVVALPELARAGRRLPTPTPGTVAGLIGGGWLVFMLAFLPSYWATGGEAPARTANLYFLVFLVCWFGTVLVLLAGRPDWRRARWYRRRQVRLVAQVAFIAAIMLLPRPPATPAAMRRPARGWPQAFFDLLGAPAYRDQWQRRYRQIEQARAAGHLHQRMPPVNYPSNPRTIAYPDITLDPDASPNRDLANYFGLEGVVLEPPEELGGPQRPGSQR